MGAWLCFEDEAGQTLRSPKGRTWGAKGGGRVSIAALVAVKPGQRPRLIYRTRTYRGRKGEPKGFGSADYAALFDGAHQHLGAPVVVAVDNLNTQVSARMRQLIAARPWLRVYQLPPYALEFNPVEAVWAHMKKSLANLTTRTLDQLADLVKNRLKRMQYRPALISGFSPRPGWTPTRRNLRH
ncbi:transposase [Sphaerisporangium corydalis]|uniref:Transposase n=1 Tax=Sphaerisporangium corydalis TaxID=1441875 RepID=A0ABV9E4Z6_9ACTN|nr:transposase [Sphaerisporangium corydalis]